MTDTPQDPGKAYWAEPVPSSLVRPFYAPGLVLEDTDLTAGLDYTRSLTRLLFRSLIGCGVVDGLTVTAEQEDEKAGLTVTVSPGLALDPSGDPIHLPVPVVVTVPRSALPAAAAGAKATAPDVVLSVVLGSGERRFARRQLVADPDEFDAPDIATRICRVARVGVVSDLGPLKPLCRMTSDPAASAPGDFLPGAGADDAPGGYVLLGQLERTAGKWTAKLKDRRRFCGLKFADDPAT